MSHCVTSTSKTLHCAEERKGDTVEEWVRAVRGGRHWQATQSANIDSSQAAVSPKTTKHSNRRCVSALPQMRRPDQTLVLRVGNRLCPCLRRPNVSSIFSLVSVSLGHDCLILPTGRNCVTPFVSFCLHPICLHVFTPPVCALSIRCPPLIRRNLGHLLNAACIVSVPSSIRVSLSPCLQCLHCLADPCLHFPP